MLGVLFLRQDLSAKRNRECRHYADIVPLGASVQPLRGTDSIMWTIKFRNGNMKRFKFPIRTTAEGSINPYANKPKPDLADLTKSALFTETNPYPTDPSQLIRVS